MPDGAACVSLFKEEVESDEEEWVGRAVVASALRSGEMSSRICWDILVGPLAATDGSG